MNVSSSMIAAVASVQPIRTPTNHAPKESPQPGPAVQQAKPVATELHPTQPVALPPVVTALTADLAAGRIAAEAARAAYQQQARLTRG